jgi:GntR family transcriptional regulator, transcriptional repressor for pyruvate dehydrogenase complex
MITPAKKQNLYEEVSRQIIEMISSGQWKPGERIMGELELSRQFQVSRNSIRESIKALELVGILESRTGIGTFVADQALLNINSMLLSNLIDEESTLVELMETRLIVEPGLTYLAVKHATEEDITELDNIIKKGKKALVEKNYTFDLGFEFHKKIFAMSHNRILINLLDSITGSLIVTRGTVFFQHLNEYILNSELDEHMEMLECIKRKDAVLAKNLMQRHIENSLNLIKESDRIESDM